MVPVPEAKDAVEAAAARLLAAAERLASAHTYLNFAETRRAAAALFSSESYGRLRRVKAAYDPADTIRSNHPVPPAE